VGSAGDVISERARVGERCGVHRPQASVAAGDFEGDEFVGERRAIGLEGANDDRLVETAVDVVALKIAGDELETGGIGDW